MGTKNIEAFYPLSPMQQGMLFHTFLAPESGIYFQQWNCKLHGKLNAGVLQQAWQEVVNRHAVLRTFFVWQDLKEPVQIVRQHVSLPWVSLDWRTLDPALQQQQLAEFLAADLARGFDLQQAPLMRLTLIRIEDETYQFVWSFHHLLLDGWSTPLVIKEVFTFYEGLSQGRRVELGAVRPYRDYIRWLRMQEMPAAEQFWREMLDGFSAPTALGIERRANVVEGDEEQYEGQEVQLTAEATAALQQFARSQQVTVNTVVQGAWALLLSRYSGSEDVMFGATVSGRPASLPGVEEMVGMFLNTLPLRVQVKSEEAIGGYLRRLQEQQVQVRQYEYSPLVDVQGWSEVGRGVPLFDTIFVFENTPLEETQSERYGGLRFSEISYIERNNYSLTIVVVPGRNLSLQVWCDGGNYDAATTRRLLEHLRTLLGAIVANPQAELSELSLLTEAERRQVLVEWNETRAEYPVSSCIHHLFEAQVRRSPAAVAARSASASLTFAELDQRANQLAHYLLASGVGSQSVVALLLDHSCETLIAILGVLKAGCAYLPLDPSHPPARMAFAVADAQAALLITTYALSERLGPGIEAHLSTPLPPVLSLDRDWQRCATQPETAPLLPPLSSSTAAYLIYTSGSTGIPKGVVIEHASLVNYICWAQSVYPTGDCALYSSLAFDLTVTSLFLPLVTGHTLYLYPQEDRTPALLKLMEDNRCQLLKLTPSHLALIRERDNRESRIRCLIVGGEALSTELAHAVSESFGHQVEIYNEYGPTEATVGCMLYRFDSETEERAWVPIGRPAANTQIYILDQRLEPTAEHVTGELYIGGAGVARGYLGRAALTAERFVPDPFSGRAGGRLYCTGDRARRLADGNIEYLGRGDEQVKYHGYRVELNELRLALSAHARVQDAVVVLRKDGVGGREQLAGYYVAPEAIAAEELRRHMQERVIAETVPQWFVHLQSLPLTLNGKVNVEALPASWVEENGAGSREETGEARTETEALLVAIWREVLGREQVRIDDNFFELGGDSILSIQIVARANRAGLQLMPRQLFVNPTVAGLAAVAGTAQRTESEQGEVRGEVPLTPIQRWFFEQELAVPGHYNLSLLLQTQRPLQADALKAVVRGLLSQHDALRLRFERGADGEWRQWHASLSEELVEQSCAVVELSGVTDEELAAAITATAEELQRSLDLQHGPVLRVVWLETGAGRGGRLLLVAHHLVVDGVSWRVLLEDLERGYEQAAGGAVVELGAKTSSYREWAEALVAEAERGLGAAEEEYWTDVARAHVVEIPGGEIAGDGTVGSAQRVEVVLSAERTRELLQEVPAAYNTQINDVLVTALARTLSWWTKRAHSSENGASATVLVDLEGHGREEVSQSVDVSRTVGWFTSIYPVVLESKPAEEVGTALKRVKEQLRAVPRRGLGFGLLRYLGRGVASTRLRDMRRAQVGFNYLGQLDQVVGEERWLAIATESAGPERDGDGQRVHAIEVNGYVVEGELHLGWAYDADRYQREEMELVAGRYKHELEELITHCVGEETSGFTPSDFPLADLSQSALDRIAANGHSISDIYTLAPLQAGLLFHSLYTPSSGEYFVRLTCTLSRKLNPEALQQAWQEVVNRHAVLRTFFVWQDLKEPVQVVRQHVTLPWLSLDWRGLDPAIQEEQLAKFLAADLARGFDLQRAPLLRFALIQTDDDTYQFVWSYHHLLLDGWSTPLVIKEVFTFYEGLTQGRRMELGAVQPYRDYIRWLREQELPAAEQFWRQLLKGFSAPTALGIERRVRTVEEVEDQYEDQNLQLTAEATAALQQLARNHQVTLNTVVQGAWALLLSRYSGSEDVVFGATVSGRPASLAGVEEMVGMFINTLPVRVQMKSEEGVGEYLRRLQEQQVEVRHYEYSPLVEVQGWSGVGRGVRLFDTITVFENYPLGDALRESSGAIDVRNVRAFDRNNLPLTLTVLPSQQMFLILRYNTSRYEPATITRMLQHLLIVLEGMSAQPEPLIADVPLLTITEEQQILFEWNETATEYPRELSLGQLFEAQAARTPEAVALLFEDRELTYRELNERANQLARYLQRAGVGPEVLAGILMDRSVHMIVAVLGILKAGGAYVPLDESDSLEQLAFMIYDSGLRLLLTRERLTEIPYAGATLNLTEQWNLVAGESVASVPNSAHPESLAYVAYTSDSTGQPRGVMIQQRSVVNLATALQHSIYREDGPRLRIGVCASPAFDASRQVAQLLHGHTLCILPEEAHGDGQQLLNYIKRYRLDGLDCTASHLKQLGASGVAELLALAPQLVLLGGEALEDTVWPSLTDSRETRFFTIYGPTECTVAATVSEVRAELPVSTIGQPLSNVKVYVLDQKQQPVGIGVAGEIYVGGDGVGRGYLNRPELTAERFIPHPYSGEEGARLYRTGDVGRYLRDGNIEYLGRHGKVDRSALPTPDALSELDAPLVLPRTETERNIAAVWREVLGLESVGIFDNFFDLGGHSLLMVQVHGKLCEKFKFEVSMVELFEHPSINSLVEHLSRQKNVTPMQDENLVLDNKLREGRNRLSKQRATRA